MLLGTTRRFPHSLLPERVVADKTQPELLPLRLSRGIGLCRTLHRWQMRSRGWRNVGFVVDWADYGVLQTVVEVDQTLRSVLRWDQRTAELAAYFFDLFDTFPLVFVVRKRNLPAANLGEIMNAGKLKQGGDAVEETHQQEPVKRRCVSNFWQICPCIEGNRRQRENRCDAKTDSVARRFAMNPERHPRQNDDENARYVNLRSFMKRQSENKLINGRVMKKPICTWIRK